ncbi:hypothetical protein BGW36DRAFT_424501 [Talaromyces proteolyticus]|uniref:Conidiation-specific protein Con-10 n=1 Tax=Talaromyces proteolyticus TaxID=1131652 RepID=A0AAD4Q3W0_9EURO|nr:uncharacterized protein BGW36DRAFT_424501 [Talaromyces proteolyticus]KAH8702218.1 hypothetical protein BGW36DRAFT_424501 [Talaromyces proteolyticus]
MTNCAPRWIFKPRFLESSKGLTTATIPRRILQHPNPGNFANRPKEEVTEIARKGGRKGGKARGVGGFHDMDPEKQRKIASKGGQASNGSFTKRGGRAREAGRTGGRPQKHIAVEDEYADVFE